MYRVPARSTSEDTPVQHKYEAALKVPRSVASLGYDCFFFFFFFSGEFARGSKLFFSSQNVSDCSLPTGQIATLNHFYEPRFQAPVESISLA